VREKEFEVIKVMKWLDAICVLFWSITGSLISSVTLLFYINKVNSNLENVFTMMYLFSQITNPLNSLPWTIGGMLQAKHSFKRVDDYLTEPTEFNDFKV
jgi:ATP-binding cassette subfamily C (CFTR/MRP) protein 10